MNVSTLDYFIRLGERFTVNFQRTLRLPEDGREYPLPPGLGAFPVFRAADYEQLPAEWRMRGDAFLPMYQREALWIGFGGTDWKPNAVLVAAGSVNAISGESWSEQLRSDPQNYLVCPDQPWLDGINIGSGQVRQFVATPLGEGLTVEEQVRGTAEGGIRITAFEPRPGIFPDEAPPQPPFGFESVMLSMPGPDMGLAAGGVMRQKIYPDPHGIEVWDQSNRASIYVHILNVPAFCALTGAPPPPTPVSAELYTRQGLPWFDLYDAEQATLGRPVPLQQVKSIGQLTGDSEPPVNVPASQLWKLGKGKSPS